MAGPEAWCRPFMMFIMPTLPVIGFKRMVSVSKHLQLSML